MEGNTQECIPAMTNVTNEVPAFVDDVIINSSDKKNG